MKMTVTGNRPTGMTANSIQKLETIYNGASPYIGTNGHWWVYNDSTHQYADSGINASCDISVTDDGNGNVTMQQ